MSTDPKVITQILNAWSAGDEGAGDRLMEHVYHELRRMAAAYLHGERRGHTLQPTALVHEVFLRLVGGASVDWRCRAHFYDLAARTMRRILVDHARAQRARKRGGDFEHLPLEQVEDIGGGRPADLIALDDALVELARLDSQKAKIVELRYFGGFGVAEIADILAVSVPTVNRHWRMARAWLATELAAP